MRDLPLPTFPIADLRAPAAPRRSLLRRGTTLPAAQPDEARIEVVWARSDDDVRQAQRLRYQVFAEEMGARLAVPKGSPAGHDIDLFDPFCEHLLVRAPSPDRRSNPVIGTYRV